MKRSSRTTAFLLAAVALGGCGADDEPRSSTTRPSPSLTERTAPEPSPSPGPTRSPPLTVAEQARLDERLRDAAWANKVTEARRLIRRGANVNAKDETVQSAYLISTSEGYLDLLRLTLHNGAKIGDKDSWNGTGLIRAAERGHHGVVGGSVALTDPTLGHGPGAGVGERDRGAGSRRMAQHWSV